VRPVLPIPVACQKLIALHLAVGGGPDVAIRVATQDETRWAIRGRDVEVEHDAVALESDFRERARLCRLLSPRPAGDPIAVEPGNASTHDPSWLQTFGHLERRRISATNRLNRSFSGLTDRMILPRADNPKRAESNNVQSVLSEHPLNLGAIRRPREREHQEDSRLDRREILRSDAPIRRRPSHGSSGIAVV
jgi:hypothetical protein